MKKIIEFLDKKEKTGIGFTGSRVAKFYKKAGFTAKQGLRRKFFPNYGNVEEEIAHWGFYVEGKDNFVSTLIKNKLNVKMSRKKW
tara:strand:+ start:74 stop:328 length:255 start_codon:yes stop_codon:yes gene_type:complete